MNDTPTPKRSRHITVALAQLLVVIFIAALLISILLPSLSRARKGALEAMLGREDYGRTLYPLANGPPEPKTVERPYVPAQIKSFVATIDLTPRLSVGTAEPESIYEAGFAARIAAVSSDRNQKQCQIEMPLPPQLISLADLQVTVNGDPSDDVAVSNDKLIWRGSLDAETPADIEVTYSALGKGIYQLEKPPGKIVDHFETTLTAHGSDVRMMSLSLQPSSLARDGDKTIYTWKFNRLMLGRPITLDVLGIAPMDKLGELSWLAPISIVVFGLLAGMIVLAHRPERVDLWMLLLIIGAFAGAYPLMYFAQEFTAVGRAVTAAAAAMLVIIGLRAVTLMGVRLGLLALVPLAGAVLAVTVLAAIRPALQGILLTGETIGAMVVAMIVLPKLRRTPATEAAAPAP